MPSRNLSFTALGPCDRIIFVMPVTTSAIKKSKQDKKARERNRVIRDDYKKAVKAYRGFIKEGNTKKAGKALSVAFSKIDIAAKRNILHKNNAARRKSRLAALTK
jgi:small subunit ribosomal protein S20